MWSVNEYYRGKSYVILGMLAVTCVTALAPTRVYSSERHCLKNVLEGITGAVTGRFQGNPVKPFVPNGFSPFDLSWETVPHLDIRIMGFVYERGVVKSGRNLYLNEVIRELEHSGGELRALKPFAADFLADFKENGLSYFRLSEEGAPILAIEPNSPRSTIEHELQHFRDWKKIRDELVGKGIEPKEAGYRANKIIGSSPKMIRWTEANAVGREIEHSGLTIFDEELTRRLIYPEIAGIVNALQREETLNSNGKRQMIEYMDVAIEKTIRMRELRIATLRDEQLSKQLGYVSRNKSEKLIRQARDLSTLKSEMGLDEPMVREGATAKLFDSRLKPTLLRLGLTEEMLSP